MNLPLIKLASHPVTIGIAAFVAARVALSPFVGVRVCRDGWHSFSIGIQGACSWHGGVGGLNHGGWVSPLSIFIGIAAGVLWANWRADRVARPPKATQPPEVKEAPPARGYKTQEQVRAELAEFFAARKADRKSPPQ